ncbi:hypothetical protein [Chitinophaga rhizophila]|uniref:Uncharacterized protein n=1 Tax=Chitinophaga rhizophila TaxID=2866212 RepID=A0ABS7GBH6_9BACT|nr:hypothetical protein [Chitinophaga rhizophila]MBW8685039.1 hypothetical protein [Chitinophaga rhizophila]
MKRITICALISIVYSCSKDNNRTFKGIVTEADNCCSSPEGGRIYRINIAGTDSTIATLVASDLKPGDAIAFNIQRHGTPPAVYCLAICTMPRLTTISDITRLE